MNPGPELDALVAKHVMGDEGYTVVTPCPDGDSQCLTMHTATRYKPYSTDIACAWQVVEKMRPHAFRITVFAEENDIGIQVVNPSKPGPYVSAEVYSQIDKCVSVPHAICLAALKVMGFEK